MAEATGAFLLCGLLIAISRLQRPVHAADGPHPRGHCRCAAGGRAGTLWAQRRAGRARKRRCSWAANAASPTCSAAGPSRAGRSPPCWPVGVLIGACCSAWWRRCGSQGSALGALPVFTAPSVEPGCAHRPRPAAVRRHHGLARTCPAWRRMRAGGVDVPLSPIIGGTGVATLLLAPFGGYALNLSADHRRHRHEPRGARRPEAGAGLAAVAAGFFYLLDRPGSARPWLRLFAALPQALVLARRGAGACSAPSATDWRRRIAKGKPERDAAVLTFLVALSGRAPWRASAAPFWAVLAGSAALLYKRR